MGAARGGLPAAAYALDHECAAIRSIAALDSTAERIAFCILASIARVAATGKPNPYTAFSASKAA